MKLTPYPFEEDVDRDLFLVVKIESPSGWVDLEDAPGFVIEASSFAESAQSWRRQMVNNPFVEGSFTVSAVKENVTESVSVWIRGEDQYEFQRRKKILTDALDQLTYRMMVRIDNVSTYWNCQTADYTLTTQREFLHARLGLLKANIPRLPSVETVLASGDEI